MEAMRIGKTVCRIKRDVLGQDSEEEQYLKARQRKASP